MPAQTPLQPRNLDGQIGLWIRQRRQDKRYSQPQLAARLNLSQGHLSRVERGLTPASIAEFVAVAAALGVDPAAALAVVVNEHVTSMPLFQYGSRPPCAVAGCENPSVARNIAGLPDRYCGAHLVGG